MTGKQRLGGSERVRHLDIRENSHCKGPAVGLYLKNGSKAANIVEAEQTLSPKGANG